MKISLLIFISITFILLLFSISTYINHRQSQTVKENREYLFNSSDIVRQSNLLHRNILYMVQNIRGYRLTGEANFLVNYNSAIAENLKLIAEVSGLVRTNQKQLKNFNKIKEAYALLKVRLLPSLLNNDDLSKGLVFKNGYTEQFRNEELVIGELREKFRTFLDTEYDIREKRRVELEKSENRTTTISFLLTSISILSGLTIALILSSYISKEILKMVALAKNVAEGKYQLITEKSPNNEFGKLVVSLNKMAETLQRNFSLLQHKNKELDQFAYVVAHDLKAPLNGIDTLISWILEEHEQETPEKVLQYLSLIRDRINKSEHLIEGILTYARVGKEMLPKEPVDVEILVNEIIENVSLKPSLQFIINNKLPTLHCQRIPLMQVFNNLISNAVKYNDKEKTVVQIGWQKQGSNYEFFVKDNGPGIEKDLHDKIFRIFQTAKETRTYESTGIGLAIVKKILDERNQQIRVESEVGDGTTFYFTWASD